MKYKNIPVNNCNYIEVKQDYDAVIIIKKDKDQETEISRETISGGDFVSMLNWYRYQKDHGNENLTF